MIRTRVSKQSLYKTQEKINYLKRAHHPEGIIPLLNLEREVRILRDERMKSEDSIFTYISEPLYEFLVKPKSDLPVYSSNKYKERNPYF